MNLLRAGYRAIIAADGEETLGRIAEDRPDLIVSDVMMPNVDGFELLRRLKADPGTMDIPVLMLTPKAQDRDICTGWAGGVHGYLTKPFNPGELLAWVAKTLESLAEAQDTSRIRL